MPARAIFSHRDIVDDRWKLTASKAVGSTDGLKVRLRLNPLERTGWLRAGGGKPEPRGFGRLPNWNAADRTLTGGARDRPWSSTTCATRQGTYQIGEDQARS